MTEGIIIALITGGLALVGTIVTSRATVNKVNQTLMQNLSTSNAVMETRMDELTREVRAHNNFAQRMPVVEEQIKVINHRIDDLEQYHKGA